MIWVTRFYIYSLKSRIDTSLQWAYVEIGNSTRYVSSDIWKTWNLGIKIFEANLRKSMLFEEKTTFRAPSAETSARFGIQT